jgi:hypothetical protein
MKQLVLFITLLSTCSLSAQWQKGFKKLADKQAGTSFIISDSSGAIWIGLGEWKSIFGTLRYNGGLKKYQNKQLTTVYNTGAFTAALQMGPEMYFTATNGFYTYKNNTMSYDPAFTLGTCMVNYKNKAWIGTLGKGIYWIDSGIRKQVHVNIDGHNMDTVYSLCADGNILWIGTSRGLVRYDGTTFSQVQVPVVTMDSKLAERRQLMIASMQIDGYGRLWVLNASNVDTIPCLYFMDKSGFREAMSYYHEQCYQLGTVPAGGFKLSRTAYGHILMTTWWGIVEMSDQLYNQAW